ncbi:hypothetical protein C2G38_2250096 [Gigaspora rosea]|uniref:Uncharacterized protein n=1 Tax=Gigaspora rosea TaxID=44941 RepID=A0A397UMR3_9GLOM|nr:hypothetical protein C2G38_2250096 [Gigaspora rosea]
MSFFLDQFSYLIKNNDITDYSRSEFLNCTKVCIPFYKKFSVWYAFYNHQWLNYAMIIRETMLTMFKFSNLITMI